MYNAALCGLCAYMTEISHLVSTKAPLPKKVDGYLVLEVGRILNFRQGQRDNTQPQTRLVQLA